MDISAIEVAWNPAGWWDVRREHGHVEARYISEFQALEAARLLARETCSDLIIYSRDEPPKYEPFRGRKPSAEFTP